jgi:hypothetical protein
MSTAPKRFMPQASPRPGVLKTLGILNIVFAALGTFCISSGTVMMYAAANSPRPEPVTVQVKVPGNQAPAPGVPMTAGFDPFIGMRDRNFIRFSIIDSTVGLIMAALMFVTGIGMINRRRWGARGWGYIAWVRIASAVLVWGYFIVAVAPSYSESMAKGVSSMIAGQGAPAGRLPPVALLTQVYMITNMVVAIMAMVITSIYPAISLWLLSRPGVKAAIIDQRPSLEQELP